MTTYLFGVLAAVCAVTAECAIRMHIGLSYHQLFLPMVPLIVGINYGVYRLLQHETLMGGIVMLSAFNTMLRPLVSVFILHERVGVGTWVAFGLMIVALTVKSVWR